MAVDASTDHVPAAAGDLARGLQCAFELRVCTAERMFFETKAGLSTPLAQTPLQQLAGWDHWPEVAFAIGVVVGAGATVGIAYAIKRVQ